MFPFALADVVALVWFIGAWSAYAIAIERSAYGRRGLNALLDGYRETWMRRMLSRDNRIIDSHILGSLQNGTAFFASTSLLAIGGALTLLRSTDEILNVIATLPFGITTTRTQWEAKAVGLTVILVYAFFKFAWSYRLFNYVAIMLGATPLAADKDKLEAQEHVLRTARLFSAAGRHFNRGQRGFFLALGYLGWFVSPWVFMAATTAVVIVMWRRQFASDARKALDHD